MASAPNQKTWNNVPPDSTIQISGESTSDQFTITVEEDDRIHRAVVCEDDGVIPGPCTRTLRAGKTYTYRIVLDVVGDPGPNVTVTATVTDDKGAQVGLLFRATAPGSAGSPYSIVLSVIVRDAE